ncbi:MAG: DUF2207 domain-containing protein [Clostridia bacterium]|nr:DUF2207 domain-containing protein [Clostridia bacterium]
MKLVKKLLVILVIALILCSTAVFAKNNVSEIDIKVTVRDDGSAYIVQNWRGKFEEGTENYIPIKTDDIEISEFKVSDEKVEYSFEEDWDVDAGFSEKAEKCGINETDDGIELCFGISEYGEKRYAIEYVVSDFIKSYEDYDGTNFMFINPDMSTFPTGGHIEIVMQNGTELCEDNAKIWSFGYDGYIEFQNGTVNAYTTSPLEDDNSMIVMLCLDKGIISPEAYVSKSFEEVKDKAFEGSDYDNGLGIFGKIVVCIIVGLVLLILIIVAVFLIRRKKAINKFYREADYFRDAPNSGDIDVSYYLALNFDVTGEKSLIIGALILSMINKGFLIPETEENIGMFGKVKQSVNIRLNGQPDTSSEAELYNILKASSGSDGILQEKELEKYAYKHPELINDFIDRIKDNGETKFISQSGFLKCAGNCIKDLSDKGKEELSEVMGLKKYLDEFTLIDEREITETIIWKEYMVYATLFGIADKVIKQMEKLYPNRVEEIESSYGRNVIIASSYNRSMYRSAQRAIQEKRSSGGGGRASFGGGGGFSGGGSGGGSR